jgi:hypothetical protein
VKTMPKGKPARTKVQYTVTVTQRPDDWPVNPADAIGARITGTGGDKAVIVAYDGLDVYENPTYVVEQDATIHLRDSGTQ